MIKLTRLVVALGATAFLLLNPLSAAAQQPEPARTLVVGTKEAPPFAIKRADGTWGGISIELWRAIARDLGYRFEMREVDLDRLVEGTADGSLDAAVAAVTITAAREQAVDFSQPFYVAGLGIAIPARSEAGWLGVARQFFSSEFLRILFWLGGLLLVVGTLVWYFERRRNPEQFGGGAAKGVGSSIWWSAVTMTTVGYGDKAPQTLGGRVIALVWMFAGIIIISSFTAAITSSLTLGQLQGPVQGPDDLHAGRVGTIPNSTSAAYLAARDIAFAPFDTPAAALRALDAGALEAVVYDEPILRYRINTDFRGRLRVLPGTFEKQYYGIVLPAESPLREPVNRALLTTITAPAWQSVLSQYLGR